MKDRKGKSLDPSINDEEIARLEKAYPSKKPVLSSLEELEKEKKKDEEREKKRLTKK